MRTPPGSRRQRGQATLEMAALAPVVLMLMLFALQVIVLTYTAHAASQAAREAARASSLGQNANGAARSSLPGGVQLVGVQDVRPGPRGHGDRGGAVRGAAVQPPDHPIGDDAMRREFSTGFLPPAVPLSSSADADDAQIRRFKQILLDEVDLQELSRLSGRRAARPARAGARAPGLPRGRDPLQPGAQRRWSAAWSTRRSGSACWSRCSPTTPSARS